MQARLQEIERTLKWYQDAYYTQRDAKIKIQVELRQSQDRERVLREALDELVRQCQNAPHQGPCEGPFAWSINVGRKALGRGGQI